jgi:hypothetical protein
MTHSSLYLLLIKEAFANCMQGMTASTEKTAMALTKEKLPLRMMSTVVRGFKRGSTELGIPTANLDRESGKFAGGSFDDLPTGIYWGFCRIGDRGYVYKTACSIGYNPTYNNTQKTVGAWNQEVHSARRLSHFSGMTKNESHPLTIISYRTPSDCS